ncbi:cytochrome P450 2H2 [Armadillidium vulgare]|nr:cytochrome P450 2H2 [Armadillidium vulgare]
MVHISFSMTTNGILSSNGHHWQEIRHFSLRHLRDLGMGKSKLVSAIHYEASELIKEIKKLAGKPGPFPEALNPAVINILWQIVASKRFDYENQEFISFGKLLDEWMDAISSNLILDIFPWLKTTLPTFLLNIISKQYVLDKVDRKLTKHFQKCVEEHKESFDKNNPRDYIDEYLIEMMKPKSNSDSSMSEVQTRLHKEIDDVIPDGHLVTLEDKRRLPYVEAFVYEVLRFSTFSPVAVPRTSNHDGAMVFATAEDIHFDPKYFDSPKEFRPERFINSEGKFEVPKNGFLPFGIGKRLCLGESLARMELFIFLTTLLQHFSFSAPLGKQIDISPLDIPLFNIPKFEQEILIINRK